MFIPALAVVSVLVVIVLLDMFPVAATDAADTDPDVDIAPVAVIEPAAMFPVAATDAADTVAVHVNSHT